MKIERVSDNIIKVTISPNDLEERNIDFFSLSGNSPAAQKLFREMMEQAEQMYGFNITDSQMIVESIPDMSDGLTIIITKIESDYDIEAIQKYVRNRIRKALTSSKGKSRKIPYSNFIYSFYSIDDAIGASTTLASSFKGASSFYKCGDIFYMRLSKKNITLNEIRSVDSRLAEFGTKVLCPGLFEGYLNEYGEKLIKSDAVRILGKISLSLSE